jgi:hypothetical protein
MAVVEKSDAIEIDLLILCRHDVEDLDHRMILIEHARFGAKRAVRLQSIGVKWRGQKQAEISLPGYQQPLRTFPRQPAPPTVVQSHLYVK